MRIPKNRGRISAPCASYLRILPSVRYQPFEWTSFPWACPTISKLQSKKARTVFASALQSSGNGHHSGVVFERELVCPVRTGPARSRRALDGNEDISSIKDR